MPVDYSLGKIYKVYNVLDESEFYIGSTAEPSLARRMSKHRACSKRKENMFRHFYTRMAEVGIEHFKIILLEQYPCENRDQLRQKEDEYIKRLTPSLNMCNAFRTCDENKEQQKEYKRKNKNKLAEYSNEYREQNREKILEQKKQHYEINREQILEKQKQYRKLNREKISEQRKAYRKNNEEKLSEHRKLRYENNRAKELEQMKEYREKNKAKISERNAKKVPCPICAKVICRSSMSRHTKTIHKQTTASPPHPEV